MENNKILTRESLEKMTTDQLDKLLQAELRRDPADGKLVRMILSVLKEREAARPVEIMPESSEVWEEYQKNTGRRQRRPVCKGRGVLKAAAAAAVVLVLFAAIPQRVEAESFFGRLARWTDSIFELFDPGEDKDPVEYVFETDNPGLQQVYDTLVELGVTEPVVPMWLPEGYELTECKVQDSPRKCKVSATFVDKEIILSFVADIYEESTNVEYQKDETEVETIEMSGTMHIVIRNNDMWVVVWNKDNIECCISANCQKDMLVEILRSIYSMEE